MENYVIATNAENKLEAFYIDESGTVMHTWQLDTASKTDWSKPQPLLGTCNRSGSNEPLEGAVRVEACTDHNGLIQVVAYKSEGGEGAYYICYQTPGFWNGWTKITQE
ncbi:hypothetical protein [Marinomonas ostreistagni]|uniref:hypothetical protein n=1 Tax=Marinomonas ostreistagni TaxID=359209 RepID=UPI00194DE30D|nr:hypothetical protein [Marinomonas ostreistagni]MBM6550158.1 hypothetical protein [Marinomonas ostreistagni]